MSTLDLLNSIGPRPGVQLVVDPPIDEDADVPSLRTLGTGPNQAVAGNDPRLGAGVGGGSFANYAAIRAAEGTAGQNAIVNGRNTSFDGGEGVFCWTPDTVATDNGGTVLVPSASPRTGCWKRLEPEATRPTWFGAVGDGVANDIAAIIAAATAAATRSNKTVIIDKVYNITTASQTIPGGITLDFKDGGRFSGTGLSTLTIAAKIEAGPYQIFSGPCLAYTGGFSTDIDPKWWGAASDYTTDDLLPVQYAIDAAHSGATKTVRMTGLGTKVSGQILARSKARLIATREEYPIECTGASPVVYVGPGTTKPHFASLSFIAAADQDAVLVQSNITSVERPTFDRCRFNVASTTWKSATADAAADMFTCTSHGFSNGTQVVVSFVAGGSVPAGISRREVYYAINATTDAFQVSTTDGGAVVDLTSAGSNVRVGKHVAGCRLNATTGADIYWPTFFDCEFGGSFASCPGGGLVSVKADATLGGVINIRVIGGRFANLKHGLWDNVSSGSRVAAGAEFDGITDCALSGGGGANVRLRGIATTWVIDPRFEPVPYAGDYGLDASGTYDNKLMGMFGGNDGLIDRGAGRGVIEGFDGSTQLNYAPLPTIHGDIRADTIKEATSSARVSFPNGVKVEVNAPASEIFDVTGSLVRLTKASAVTRFLAADGSGGECWIGFDDPNNVGILDGTGNAIYLRHGGSLKAFLFPSGLAMRSALNESRGSDIATAASMDLPRDGNLFLATGSVTIDYMQQNNWDGGALVSIVFGAGTTINHASGSPGANYATFILKSGSATVIAAGIMKTFRLVKGAGLSTAWHEV